MRYISRYTLVAIGLAVSATSLPALAEGLPPIEWKGTNGATISFYGQINKGILSYDDGRETESYGLIDNGNSSTRFGMRYSRPIGDWTFGNRLEFEYAPFSTKNANQQNRSNGDWGFDNDNIRWIDFSAKNSTVGTFSLGQGSMATDNITEIDLSGTEVIAYSNIGDSAAAQLLRYSDPALADAFGPSISSTFANYDGSRLTRLRYDTRSFNGFSGAVAFGRNLLSDNADTREINQYDIALRYESELDSFNIKAGLGYFATDKEVTVWSGSASALHTPTGLNVTLAAGTRDNDGTSGEYWYGKLGLLRDFVSWGSTAMAVDYYNGSDIYTADDVTLVDSDGDTVFQGDIDSSTSKSWSVSVVQKVAAANTELWLTYRSYDFSDNLTGYEDGQAVFGGARFKF